MNTNDYCTTGAYTAIRSARRAYRPMIWCIARYYIKECRRWAAAAFSSRTKPLPTYLSYYMQKSESTRKA
ncbi:MAG: hypothetical protein KBT20_00910 [Bacteroidales bacterium]|nr:hypothetical protein [Candidatus Liminaster caballi]